MNRTAISNPYFMEAIPRDPTPILVRVGANIAHCYGCGRDILPRIIDTRFFGDKTSAVCPDCCTNVQTVTKAEA